MNFIDYYLQYTADAESPDEFWFWSALACLAGVLRNNVYVPCGTIQLYPNMYVILYSDSGVARKGLPCKIASKLIKIIGNTKVISGRASVQAIVRELAQTTINKLSGHTLSDAAGILYSEELSSFIVQDQAAIPMLIDLYDYHDEWQNNLISNASYKLTNVCISMLAASNSDLFRTVYTDLALKGGLLGRSYVIKAERARHKKSLLELGGNSVEITPLIQHLRKLTTLRGKVSVSRDATEEFNNWYHNIPDEFKADKIGFGSRLDAHALKIATCLAAARSDFDMLIKREDIERAIYEVNKLRANYKSMFVGMGVATTSYQASLIIRTILSQRDFQIKRSKLIQRTLGDIDMQVLDGSLLLLIQSGLIAEVGIFGEPGYKLTDYGIRYLTQGEE